MKKNKLIGIGISSIMAIILCTDDLTAQTSSGKLYFSTIAEDKLSLFGNRFNAPDMYGFGVGQNTMYTKSNQNHAFLINKNVAPNATLGEIYNNSTFWFTTNVMRFLGPEPRFTIQDNSATNPTYSARLYLLKTGSDVNGGYLLYHGTSDYLGLGIVQNGTQFPALSIKQSDRFVGIGTTAPTSRLHVSGGENDGTDATLKLVSGSQTMLLDGNEIDGLSGVFINSNSKKNVILGENGGNVGIGLDNPTSTLQIKGIENDGTNASLKLITGDQSMMLDGNEIDVTTQLYINNNSKKDVTICGNGEGNVGIGTNSPDYKLHVKGTVRADKLDVTGTIRAEEVTVYTGWSDFVFNKNYNLKSLKEVENFIDANGHLPEIPNTAEVEKNGVALGQIESKLLMKIEELTLYIIQQEKRLSQLEIQLTTKKQD